MVQQKDSVIMEKKKSYDSLRIATYERDYTDDYVFRSVDTEDFIHIRKGPDTLGEKMWIHITDTLLLSTIYSKTQEIKSSQQDSTIKEPLSPDIVSIMFYDSLADTLSVTKNGKVLLNDGLYNMYTSQDKDIYYLLFYTLISQGVEWWDDYENSAFEKYHNSSLDSLIRPLMK